MGNAGIQMRKGALELCVLTMIARKPRYGFELVKRLADVGGLVASEGAIYPMLTRLRTSGFVVTNWIESVDGPPRRYYSITPRGQTFATSLLGVWHEFSTGVERILKEETK